MQRLGKAVMGWMMLAGVAFPLAEELVVVGRVSEVRRGGILRGSPQEAFQMAQRIQDSEEAFGWRLNDIDVASRAVIEVAGSSEKGALARVEVAFKGSYVSEAALEAVQISSCCECGEERWAISPAEYLTNGQMGAWAIRWVPKFSVYVACPLSPPDLRAAFGWEDRLEDQGMTPVGRSRRIGIEAVASIVVLTRPVPSPSIQEIRKTRIDWPVPRGTAVMLTDQAAARAALPERVMKGLEGFRWKEDVALVVVTDRKLNHTEISADVSRWTLKERAEAFSVLNVYLERAVIPAQRTLQAERQVYLTLRMKKSELPRNPVLIEVRALGSWPPALVATAMSRP